jgi:hypothetical protein
MRHVDVVPLPREGRVTSEDASKERLQLLPARRHLAGLGADLRRSALAAEQ